MAILAEIKAKQDEFMDHYPTMPNILMMPIDRGAEFDDTVKALVGSLKFLSRGEVTDYRGMRVMSIVGPLSVALEVQG